MAALISRAAKSQEYSARVARFNESSWASRPVPFSTRTSMANCVTCGKELHPERAEKYDYCTDPECQQRNARGLEMVAVGVNKAADEYMVLDERTKRQMASGRFKKQPDVQRSLILPPRQEGSPRRSAPARASRPVPRASRPRWSEGQEN